MSLPRLAIIGDFVEENWPSMDLIAETMFTELQQNHAGSLSTYLIRPSLRRRFARLPIPVKRNAFNADRLLNRLWDYPRELHRVKKEFDLYHLADHSYGQLVHHLRSERTVVTCHDLDTFRCLLYPESERRGRMFRAVTKHTLNGLRKAARVICVSEITRNQLLEHGLLSPDKVLVIPNGVHPGFSSEANPIADAAATNLLGQDSPEAIDILHVGSTVQRKRIDLLLKIIASLRREFPQTRLIRVGGPFTRAQIELITRLGLEDSILILPKLDRDVLAAVYRRATLLLQPSEREGFGLPVVEAMACGTTVVASDIPALREVGGAAATYCSIGEISEWTYVVIEILHDMRKSLSKLAERQNQALMQASKFSWAAGVNKLVGIYQELLSS
jgi:glycosyltransferase involved in cell wall biosynthesis